MTAAMINKSGTGTGSAQVVSLDAAERIVLGDGQVTVESTVTDRRQQRGFVNKL